MRKISEILRLKAQGLSDRLIGVAIGSSRSTVQECLRRCREAGIGWPLPAGLAEAGLFARLYQRGAPARHAPAVDFAEVHRELARPGVTRELLWQEYKAREPQGLQYTAFCNHYRRWLGRQELVLRQEHLPGDKAFVDYAGQTVPIVDRLSGEVRAAQIFIAVLGCSNYTYAEASGSQKRPDWLASHVRALCYFGGCPAAIVPDNLKSAVTKARRYEPDLNPAYHAAHSAGVSRSSRRALCGGPWSNAGAGCLTIPPRCGHTSRLCRSLTTASGGGAPPKRRGCGSADA